MTCAHWARCHGGSWWWSTAGRPRSRAATARAAGRFSGIVQRFSTTTRSAPASAASSSAAVGGVGGADRQAREEVVDRVRRRRRCGPSTLSSRAPAPRWRPPPRRHRDARAGTTRRRPRARRHATDRRGAHRGGAAAAGCGVARRRGRRVLRAEPHDLPVAVAVGQLLPRGGVGAPRRRAGGASSCAPRCRAGRRRLRAAPSLRRRAVPARGALGPAGRVDDHPAADVRARRRRAHPPRDARPTTSWSSAAQRGLEFLLRRRRRSPGGLVELCHPWESGCDDSPRWDDTMPGGRTPDGVVRAEGRAGRVDRADAERRADPQPGVRGRLGRASARWWRGTRSSWRPSPATTAWRRDAGELAEAIDERWDAELRDLGRRRSDGGRLRPDPDPRRAAPVARAPAARGVRGARSIRRPTARRAGPAASTPASPPTSPTAYWRGSAWPQLTYLLWLAATSSGSDAAGSALVRSIVAGAERSGFAEHWVADTGAPLGAVPQTWSTLALAVRVGR